MTYRTLGRTGWNISTISFGAWAIGGTWGAVQDDDSMASLHRALDEGVNFFDTADVYGDGRSEQLLARLKRERREPFSLATKAGRRLDPHVGDGYTKKNLTAFVERSLKNLFLVLLPLCVVPALSTQAQISEDDAVKFVKSLSPSVLDSTLPEGDFSAWLASIIGDSATVQWELNDCGEQTGDPTIDNDRDIPGCVGIYVMFPDQRTLGLTIIVGTSRKGLTGVPAVYDIYLESKGTFVGVKRLRDLPEALKRSVR